MRKLSMEELNRKTVAEFREAPKNPVVVVLDNVRSMHNVGAVFRTADAFLLEGVVLCGYTPRPPHRDIHKTALGATETVYWEYFCTTVEAVNELKNKGYQLYAAEQTAGSRWLQEHDWSFDRPVAVVFGNEVTGVDEAVLALCDGSIEIPQAGMKHSLNISVAAGIILWDMFKHRLQAASKSDR